MPAHLGGEGTLCISMANTKSLSYVSLKLGSCSVREQCSFVCWGFLFFPAFSQIDRVILHCGAFIHTVSLTVMFSLQLLVLFS